MTASGVPKGGAEISTEQDSFSLICNVLRIKKTWMVSYFCPTKNCRKMKRNSFNVLFFIKKAKLLKNGEASVCMRITVNGARVETNIRKSIDPASWNQAKECARGKSRKALKGSSLSTRKGLRLRNDQKPPRNLTQNAATIRWSNRGRLRYLQKDKSKIFSHLKPRELLKSNSLGFVFTALFIVRCIPCLLLL